MLVDIEEIKVKNRIRRDDGELLSLIESIKKHGLLNPILIDREKNLIAGERRLKAVKHLGWRQIEAKVLNLSKKSDLLEIEMDENNCRKPFNREEIRHGNLLLSIENERNFLIKLLKKLILWIKGIFKKR